MLLAYDPLTAASDRILIAASRERTTAIINSHETMPAHFTHDRDFDVHGERLSQAIAAGTARQISVDATALATALLGDAIAANLFTLGFGWQQGLIPIGRDAIEEAIRLNGVAVAFNLSAFLWGRRAAADRNAVDAILGQRADRTPVLETLDEMVERRSAFLRDYQNHNYAQDYRAFVEEVRQAEHVFVPGAGGFDIFHAARDHLTLERAQMFADHAPPSSARGPAPRRGFAARRR